MSRFDEFKESALNDTKAYREKLQGNGSFEYKEQVAQLMNLSIHININLLVYLFGPQTGARLAEIYVKYDRNLLTFLAKISPDYRMFILYELKTNETLFSHC